MAADSTLANAYKQFYDTQAQADLASDPFYIATNLATLAAAEWNEEKKKDNERARKKGEAISENMDEMFITAVDGYNEQGKELMHSTMSVFNDQMNEAVKNKDKKAIARIQMDSRSLASEFVRGQSILKEHAEHLKSGTYSNGAGTATLNKLLKGGPDDYEIYMETDVEKPNYLKPFFKIKDNNGGVQLLSFDDLDKGNVKRADEFGTGYDKLIKGMVKEATSTGVYEFDGGQVERLLDKQLASTDVMYSAFHDNIFGEKESIKQKWDAEHKNMNTDWQMMWNDEIPPSDDAISGTIQNSGFNETQMREYTKSKMMEMAKQEYDTRLKAYQKKVSASENKNKNNNNSDKFQYDDYKYVDKDVINNVASNIKNNKKVVFEGLAYTPDGNGGWLTDDGDELTTEELIYSMDKNRGYIRNSSLFTNIIKPTL